jgi:hypothetical protein
MASVDINGDAIDIVIFDLELKLRQTNNEELLKLVLKLNILTSKRSLF